jgi:hypothetical protein
VGHQHPSQSNTPGKLGVIEGAQQTRSPTPLNKKCGHHLATPPCTASPPQMPHSHLLTRPRSTGRLPVAYTVIATWCDAKCCCQYHSLWEAEEVYAVPHLVCEHALPCAGASQGQAGGCNHTGLAVHSCKGVAGPDAAADTTHTLSHLACLPCACRVHAICKWL